MNLIQQGRRWRVSLLTLLAVGAAGCDGLLEETPLSTITPVNFYQTAQDAETALMAVYASFDYVGNDIPWTYLIENITPQSVNRRGTSHNNGCWEAFRCSPSNPSNRNIWNTSYAGINRANAVLGNVPAVEMEAGQKARILAEARFLRGLHYFQLVRLFGGVPIFDSETKRLGDVARPRATADEIYDFIIADLSAAVQDLPETVPTSEFGRATKGAARTLLGKVYLQRAVLGASDPFGDPLVWPSASPGDLEAAITEFRAVVNSGQYALVPDYGSLWRPETEINSEAIFSIRFAPIPGLGNRMCTYGSPLNSAMCFRQFAAWGGEVPFVESYAPTDVRRDVTWILEFDSPDGTHRVFDFENVLGDNYGREYPAPGKYTDPTTVSGISDIATGPTDFTFLRYADVLLSLAEALWRQNSSSGEALQLVNQIRERANVEPLSVLTEEALYWERAWELSNEQQGWYDGARFWEIFKAHVEASSGLRETQPEKYDQGQPVPSSTPEIVEPMIRLIPIPQSAMDLNPNLIQNPGY